VRKRNFAQDFDAPGAIREPRRSRFGDNAITGKDFLSESPGCRGVPSGAEKGRLLSLIPENHTAGVGAHVDPIELVPGINRLRKKGLVSVRIPDKSSLSG
jgi:hypothetical protein